MGLTHKGRIGMIKSIIGATGVGLGVAIIIGIALIMPVLYIWALNTLFALSIAYSFENWCAVVLLHMFFQATITLKDKK